MTEVRRVNLPGVGIRYEFTTRDGKSVAVVSHRSGRRELLLGSRRDPDAFQPVLDVSEDEGRTLAELLGGSRVAEQLAELQHHVQGLAIDWLPVREDSPYRGRTIGDARVRTRTGVSVVAMIRGDDAFPAPGPEMRVEAGDYLVVVGTARGIESLVELLHTG